MSKYTIEVGTSSIRVLNYEWGDSERLERQFSVWDMITHKYNYFAISYDEEKKILYLPRGIDLYYVQGCLKVNTEDLIYLKPYNYEVFDNIGMRYKPRDDNQRKALKFMLGLDEYKRNNDYSMLLIAGTTGFGKSYCSIFTICYTKIKSIVITYALTILEQWANYIFQYTNMKKDDVYLIKGADSINMLLQEKTKYTKAKIYLVSHATLQDYASSYGWDKIGNLFETIKVGQCFIDEAHRNFDNICKINAHVNVYKTYFITATPNRSSERENKIYQLAIKNIPAISLYNPDKDKHTNYIAIKWSSCPSPQQKSNMFNVYGLDRHKYIDYVVRQPNFYKILRVIMNMVIKAKGPVLFYIDTNAAILIVYKWISENYPMFAGDIGIYSGLVSSDEKYKEKLNKRIILSTTNSSGAAEQIDGLKMAIVLAAPFKSTVTAMQAAGRLRDPNTYFIELIDLSFQTIKKFYYYKLPTYHERMLTVQDVNFNQNSLDTKAEDLKIIHNEMARCTPFYSIDTRFGVLINPINQYPLNEPICPLNFINTLE